jgi:addiction module HigA family antidote
VTGTPTPDGPRALLSPDGSLLAWRTSARHYNWRCTDGYDREPEDVADWTPLAPAGSTSRSTPALPDGTGHWVPGVGTPGSVMAWRCQGCQRLLDGNPRFCTTCRHTVFAPVHFEVLSSPATDPEPATPPLCSTLPQGMECPGRPGIECAGCTTPAPVAPQAPAEPSELPGPLLSATLATLGMTQAELARQTGISTKHINQVLKGKAGLGVEMASALERVTGLPKQRWLHAEANRLAGPAVPEDTATRPWTAHEVEVKNWYGVSVDWTAGCKDCPEHFGGTEQEVNDWADSHRADTTRPAGEESQ